MNIDEKDDSGMTALMRSTSLSTSRLLIEQGADINAKDNWGLTALMHVKKADIAKTLIDSGADVNAKSLDGFTPIITASTASVTKVLIEHGADLNAQDCEGATALFYSPFEGKIKLLVEAGANLEIRDKKGNTAIMSGGTYMIKAQKGDKVITTSFFGRSKLSEPIDLMEAGANIFVNHACGDNVLHTIVGKLYKHSFDPRYVLFAEKLIRAGVDPLEKNFMGDNFFEMISDPELRAHFENIALTYAVEIMEATGAFEVKTSKRKML